MGGKTQPPGPCCLTSILHQRKSTACGKEPLACEQCRNISLWNQVHAKTTRQSLKANSISLLWVGASRGHMLAARHMTDSSPSFRSVWPVCGITFKKLIKNENSPIIYSLLWHWHNVSLFSLYNDASFFVWTISLTLCSSKVKTHIR